MVQFHPIQLPKLCGVGSAHDRVIYLKIDAHFSVTNFNQTLKFEWCVVRLKEHLPKVMSSKETE
jgi:hypothetical protein